MSFPVPPSITVAEVSGVEEIGIGVGTFVGAGDRVVAAIAVEMVADADAGEDRVVARAAIERVDARAAVDDVVAAVAIGGVVAGFAIEIVGGVVVGSRR